MKTKDIHQSTFFSASPIAVYEAIMDAEKHAAFTGSHADIDRTLGGKFSVHGGYITGQNLELDPGKKIVQSWRAEEENWPDDYYSKVIFSLKGENGGTTLNFTHEGVPEEHVEDITDGWVTYYWEPMKKMLES